MGMLWMIALSLAWGQSWFAAPLDDFISCSRDADVRPTNVRIRDKARCEGHTVIQGISFKCGKVAEADDLRGKFMNDINANARRRCQEFCSEEVGENCAALYTPFSKCVTVHNDLENMGKHIGCHPTSCEGQAFIYCSIYRGSFFRIEDGMFTGQQPNCTCYRPKKRRQ